MYGDKLANVRKRLGLTQTEARQIMGVGSAVESWERGATAMNVAARVQVATMEGIADKMPQIISGLCARLAEHD